MLGGDFNCALNDLDKRGGRSVELKKAVIQEINNLINTHDQGGRAAAFDLAAYAGYMIARAKKSVNHSRIIQGMRERSFSFLFRRHIGF